MKSRREDTQRKRRSTLTKQRAERIRMLLHEHAIDSEDEIPIDAIPADIGNQRGGYQRSPLKTFYRDEAFICKECGGKEIWKAEDQQWYYEIVKGAVQNSAVLCHECRMKKKEANQPVQYNSVDAPRKSRAVTTISRSPRRV